MSSILILGGSGILSLEVLKECLKRNYDVTCITRGKRDYRFPKGVNIIHGDVNNIRDLVNNLDSHYDAIFDFLSFNKNGLKNKLDYLSKKCSQYFFVSSSVAYSFEDAIITENTKLGNEFWDYGHNKVECEKFLTDNYSKYDIKYTIIRPYITYGTTRIPFGIIPVNGEYWSLANRLLQNKPILMWDDGKAKCTLTNTVDFAHAFVDLVGNKKAYNQAFHITSGEVLTWMQVLQLVSKELGVNPIVFSAPTEKIVDILPEYKGVLEGDKARDRIFDNRKIVDAAPNFKDFVPFSEGISQTIQHYKSNPIERTIDYRWDGMIDRAIILLDSQKSVDRKTLKFASSEKSLFRNKIEYLIGRYVVFGYLNNAIHFFKRGMRKIGKKIIRITRKNKNSSNITELKFAKCGDDFFYIDANFGKDTHLISIGKNVHLENNVQFINYRPSAQYFGEIFGDKDSEYLRDLGPIIIEDNVFIGRNVTLLPGIQIGKKSLILDGSVVCDDIPAESVAIGNPAKVIGTIQDWYNDVKQKNESYPWYKLDADHSIVEEKRKEFFFSD